MNKELRKSGPEQKVKERTRELLRTIDDLEEEIKKRKKTEKALRRSELRYRTIVEEASDAILITDRKGNLLEKNSSFCKMFGYSQEELNKMNMTSLADHGQLQTHPLRFDLLLKGSAILRERRMKKKDGTIFDIEEKLKMLPDKKILAVVRDITGRKKAEAATRKSEDGSRLIIDTIPTMAWSLGRDGIVDFLNKPWMDYTGISLQQFIKDPMRPIHPKDRSRAAEMWQVKMKVEQPYDDEMRLQRADGEYRWFLVRTAPLRDEHGKLIKWYGVSIDIEDSKRAEDELRLAYQRLSYHVENTPLAVIEWDPNLNISRWSKRAEEIFGWKSSEMIGKNMYKVSIIYEKDIQVINNLVSELMQGLEERKVSLNRNYTKDGNIISCEWYNSVLRDEQGNVVTILSLVENVTERKKAEETLSHSYQQIRSLTEHLQNIREDERKYIAREIHDELGQQLTVLKLDVSWLTKRLTTSDGATKNKLKDLHDLLDATVTSVRRISYELRPILLDEFGLAAAMEWYLKEFAKRSPIKTYFHQPKKELTIDEAVKTNLFRIFQESLTNVARHSEASKVNIDLMQNRSTLQLQIQDNGKGFSKEKTKDRRTLGILGMNERAASLGWQYEIQSEPGKGTIVSVVVPSKKRI